MAIEKIKQVTTRRQRNSLTEALILDAAQELASTGKEISLRAVASELKCSPMAIYRHFPDKESMLLALLDRLLGQLPTPVEDQDWVEDIAQLASLHMQLLQANPWAIALLFENPDPGPAARRIGEAFLAGLRRSGASIEESVKAFAAILAFNYGWAGFTAAAVTASKSSDSGVKLNPQKPIADELPNTAASWQFLAQVGSRADHKSAIRGLLAGLAHHLPK